MIRVPVEQFRQVDDTLLRVKAHIGGIVDQATCEHIEERVEVGGRLERLGMERWTAFRGAYDREVDTRIDVRAEEHFLFDVIQRD